jgi:peptidoglycan/xylan/chitin deacetylase (PgdA/CDA1 family)
MQLSAPIVSFTFDDFPRSALLRGGAILREQGFLGTYYASFGLVGQTGPTDEIFSLCDLDELARQRHELGCHTFDHCDAWDTPTEVFESSMLRNQEIAAQRMPGVTLTSLAYPISYPRPATKRRVGAHYACARGGGQTFNCGRTDLNYLKAFFIEQSRDGFLSIERVIAASARARGWLIFATHDVSETPTRFGCTPHLFERIVRCAAASGAIVLPMAAALERVGFGKTAARNADPPASEGGRKMEPSCPGVSP